MGLHTTCLTPVNGTLKERCGKDAQGRSITKTTHDGQRLSHFECEGGHLFHTDETCQYYFECDCRSRYARTGLTMSASL
jgi:hypothetical protein